MVVSCAAITDVDGCTRNPEQAYLLNGDALVELAAHYDVDAVTFVHFRRTPVFMGWNANYTVSWRRNEFSMTVWQVEVSEETGG
ncbi:hypothetical protein [Halorubellus litoreus]|uniref:Uncharacterized protein n=1 Tax=Halorubellus litoreus TaxID=755308 RepID=A0ABD5VB89_9EURY